MYRCVGNALLCEFKASTYTLASSVSHINVIHVYKCMTACMCDCGLRDGDPGLQSVL